MSFEWVSDVKVPGKKTNPAKVSHEDAAVKRLHRVGTMKKPSDIWPHDIAIASKMPDAYTLLRDAAWWHLSYIYVLRCL